MADDMEIYAKFSARGYENPKLMELALNHPNAYRVWTWAIMYSVRNLTDGFVAEIVAKNTLFAKKKDLEILENLGFFEPNTMGTGDGISYLKGWFIHDFLDAQGRSRADVEELKAKKAEAGRQGGIASGKARAKQTGSKGEAPASDVLQAPVKQTESKTKPDTDTDTDSNLLITPLTPSKPDLAGLLDSLERLYPTNRFDGKTSQARMQLEIEWPKIVKAAGEADPREFLEAKTRAYVGATEERFVKTFSRFIGGELYARNWEKPKPETPSPRQVQPVKSRSQQNLEANMAKTWQYMTEEERARYSQGGFNAQQG